LMLSLQIVFARTIWFLPLGELHLSAYQHFNYWRL